MTKKSDKPEPVAITIPRSFAALSRAASTNKESPAWLRTVLLEQLPLGRVRGTAVDGVGLMRMEAYEPEVQADLFGGMLKAASPGSKAAPSADDLATIVKAVRPPKEGDPPPVEIVVGDETRIRCGSASRRVQIDGDTALTDWPDSLDHLIPGGDVVAAQLYSTERLRDLLAAILAAGAATVKVEMREGLTALRLCATGQDGEGVVGVLMPLKTAGEAVGLSANPEAGGGDGARVDLHEVAEKAAAECRAEGMDVEVEKP